MHFTQGAKEPTVGATLKFTYYNPPCLINSIDTFKFLIVLSDCISCVKQNNPKSGVSFLMSSLS